MTTYPPVDCLLVLTATGPLDTSVGNPLLLNSLTMNSLLRYSIIMNLQ
jgi:hypothetical protein